MPSELAELAVVLVDNYDSFTHNLAHLCARVTGRLPEVVRNDALTLDELAARAPDAILLSPGPGSPHVAADVGLCTALVEGLVDTPILGVCLGHQVIAAALGARIVPAPAPMHGRLARVRHEGRELFEGLPDPLQVVRYHSLIVDAATLSNGLRATAWLDGDPSLVMALGHAERPLFGVQFHPESILTEQGAALLANFLTRAALHKKRAPRRVTPPRASATSPAPPRTRVLQREVPYIDSEHAFLALHAHAERAFWLDGSGRFSYVGEAGRGMVTARGSSVEIHSGAGIERREGDPFSILADLVVQRSIAPDGRFPFTAGWVGWLGYELKQFTEGGDGPREEGAPPDALLLLADRVLALDHHERRASLFALVHEGQPEPAARAFLDEESIRLASALEVPPPPSPTAEPHEAAWPPLPPAKPHEAAWPPLPPAKPHEAAFLPSPPAKPHEAAFLPSPPAKPHEAAFLPSPIAKPHEAAPPPLPNFAPLRFHLDADRARYHRSVERIHELLREGQTYEICLTTQARARLPGGTPPLDPLALHRLLRRTNPAPWSSFLRFPGGAVVSASPERFVHIAPGGAIESRPIKGTRRRGATPDEDTRLASDLATHEKDRAENLMIVDLVRHDLGRVCEAGSVIVPRLMEVEAHPSVFQLVSTVRGQLRAGVPPLEAVRALFPGGSMTGAPKIRAMRFIAELEGRPRGVYSGGIGAIGLDGGVDLAMAIRTVVVHGGEISFGVGGAVVALSEAEDEYQEALLKGRSLARAVAAAAGCVLADDDPFAGPSAGPVGGPVVR